MSAMVKLTEKQKAALVCARANGGRIFQLPEDVNHAPAVLASLTKRKLLDRKPVGVIWELTPEGRDALQALEK